MKELTVWPQIDLDRSAAAPTLRRQIQAQLTAAIRSGTLPGNCRIPSSRLMAKVLGVSRGTVVEAYESLLATGELVATMGSGVRVASGTTSVPNFSRLKRTAIAAHFPARVWHLDDCDGTSLYLNFVG